MIGPLILAASGLLIVGALLEATARHRRWSAWLGITATLVLAAHLMVGSEPFLPRLYPLLGVTALVLARSLRAILHSHPTTAHHSQLVSVLTLIGVLLSLLVPAVVLPFHPYRGAVPDGQVVSYRRYLESPAQRVLVQVWLPRQPAGALRIVLLAPNSLSTSASAAGLAERLAARDMLVVAPQLPKQSLWSILPDGRVQLGNRTYIEHALAVASGRLSTSETRTLLAPYQEERRIMLAGALDAVRSGRFDPDLPPGSRIDPDGWSLVSYMPDDAAVLELCKYVSGCRAIVLVDHYPVYSHAAATPAMLALTTERYREQLARQPFLAVSGADAPIHATLEVPVTGPLSLTGLRLQIPWLAGVLEPPGASADALYQVDACLTAWLTDPNPTAESALPAECAGFQ
ncbi:MAG: hypothetical protein GXY52_06300 [Chloroflexi bacterium]|nr:hypothetical protein [Chloroflexota bacterium]